VDNLSKKFWKDVERGIRESKNLIPEGLYKATIAKHSRKQNKNKYLNLHSKAALERCNIKHPYIAQAIKSTNLNYQSAKASYKADEWRYRKQKCLDRLRCNMSRDRFAELLVAVSQLEGEDLAEWVVKCETSH